MPVGQAHCPPTTAPGGGESLLHITRLLRPSGQRRCKHLRDEGAGEPQPQHGTDEVAPARLPRGYLPHLCTQLVFLEPHGSPPLALYGPAICTLR
jgi:hypothetical protein